MYISILGRQPAIGMAELERIYGADATAWHGSHAATVNCDKLNISNLGGSLKAGLVIAEAKGDWQTVSRQIVQYYTDKWQQHDGKITLGISVYDLTVNPREVQKTGIVLKQNLKKHGVSLRIIPNKEPALNTAASHHNKLGLSPNKVEILVVADRKNIIVAESVGAQNISAYAARDQERPKRDAFVGMLPPKLAQIMVNLATQGSSDQLTVLDPFCGTGVVLQEALIAGYNVYGSDLSDKMIDYSNINIDWIKQKYHLEASSRIHQGDAMTTKWQAPIDAIVCEGYLGQPFSAPPSPAKLREVRGNCNHIISSFLKNLAQQISTDTPVCLAVPAWRDASGRLSHLDLTSQLDSLGYQRVDLQHIDQRDLVYFREDQVVARELLILRKK